MTFTYFRSLPRKLDVNYKGGKGDFRGQELGGHTERLAITVIITIHSHNYLSPDRQVQELCGVTRA